MNVNQMKNLNGDNEIVIVGGGVSGLAVSLALHRKGIRSVVLERADSIRVTGVNITIYTNGWRALEQLGIASQLRSTAVRIQLRRDISLDDHHEKLTPSGKEEIRCLRRRDLVETLANELPPETIKFGHHIVAIGTDSCTSYPIIYLHNGKIIKPKIVIGCDGVNSKVSKYLGLKPPAYHSVGSYRGFTSYVDGHGFGSEFVEMKKGNTVMGRAPINENLVCWFLAKIWNGTPFNLYVGSDCAYTLSHPSYMSTDADISKDSKMMKLSALEAIKDFPSEMVDMVRQSDLNSLSLSRIRHRSLKEVALNNFRRGNVTVAGDAMHVMGPYFGQGGCSALEDAIVLARSMVREMRVKEEVEFGKVRVAFDNDVNGPAQYDCGNL
ncbi:uncharacterized protein [Phyllobates terribilis]|uniref:uncharacterized protein n=1 Tax=Phyllobates terribilis TaxID=111132 RepID=UPI003CCAE7EB